MSRTAVFTVTLSRPHEQTVTVDYATVPGTAVSPSDFTSISGTLTFLAGQTTKQINVPIRDPVFGSIDEQFTVQLSAPVNATVVDGTGVGLIPGDTENPNLVTVSVSDVQVD